MLSEIVVCHDFYAAWKGLPREVQDEILEYLTLHELHAITRPPNDTHASNPQPVRKERWMRFAARARKVVLGRVQGYLREFCLPFDETLDAMREFSTLWSGSSVLAIGQPGQWNVADMDFYTPKPYAPRFIEFLQDQGYFHACSPVSPGNTPVDSSDLNNAPLNTLGGRPSYLYYLRRFSNVPAGSVVTTTPDGRIQQHQITGPYVRNQGIESVFTLYNGHGKKVNVIQSTTSTAWTPILFLHSTVVMNAISHKGIVSLYGEMTFRAQTGLQNYGGQLDRYMEFALEKYRSRGFQLYGACGDFGCPCKTDVQRGYPSLCQTPTRFLGDPDTMVVTFDGEEMVLPATTKWKLGGNYEVMKGLYIEKFPRAEIQEQVVRVFSRGLAPRFTYALLPVPSE